MLLGRRLLRLQNLQLAAESDTNFLRQLAFGNTGQSSFQCILHKLGGQDMSRVMRKPAFCICENKGQISCAVTAQLISAFVFATQIVQSLFFLNPRFPASNHLLWLYSPVCLNSSMSYHFVYFPFHLLPFRLLPF